MSKSIFGLLLVALGLCGTWFLISGQIGGIIKRLQDFGATGTTKSSGGTSSTSSSSSNLGANTTGGNSAPLGGSNSSTTSYNELHLTSPLLAYGVVVGDNGARIEPVSSAN